MVRTIAQQLSEQRRKLYPDDPPYVTDAIKNSPEYRQAVDLLGSTLASLVEQLAGSTPFYSYRWNSHMNWDITLPGALGYLAAMLLNPNNVAAEASPVTTPLEMEVGNDLCRLLGYPVSGQHARDLRPDEITPWGHITCDGTVANIESMWAARNLKLFPVALSAALREDGRLAKAKKLQVTLLAGGSGILADLDPWTVLNLRGDDILALPQRIKDEFGIDPNQLTPVLADYSVQNLGLASFWARYLGKLPPLVVFGPSTMHYSWPKGAAILGIGAANVIDIEVDLDARMDVELLAKRLQACLDANRPVCQVVVVLGSTEESAVDPLAKVVELRNKFRKKGLEFELHVDAAWGGYFASMLREAKDASTAHATANQRYTPSYSMSRFVQEQYEALAQADSITIDPHKSGFIPYPAGGLCYRNSAMRGLVSFTAPVVYHGGVDPTVGVYGVEGSKPGAAPAAVYVSHRVIRPDRSGYGQLLGQTLFNSKRLYASLVTMAEKDDSFFVVALQRLPAEREGKPPDEVEKQRAFIREQIVPATNEQLIGNANAMKLFREMGSDLTIIAYTFNFLVEGAKNQDVALVNKLNNTIFTRLSMHVPSPAPADFPPLIVTSSQFDPAVYGACFMDGYRSRLGIVGGNDVPIAFLISTTMNPWVTDTAQGNFLPVIIDAYRKVVREEVAKILFGKQ